MWLTHSRVLGAPLLRPLLLTVSLMMCTHSLVAAHESHCTTLFMPEGLELQGFEPTKSVT